MTQTSYLVHQTTTGTGTGTLTVAAVTGRRSFNTAFGTGSANTFNYFISNRAANEWEFGTGYMSDATTLVRSQVIDSSNAGSAVNFSAGTKDVTNDNVSRNKVFPKISGSFKALGGVDLNVNDFGLGIGGDDVAAMNDLIDYINSVGDPIRSNYDGITVNFPAGKYDFSAGGLTSALQVSNVHFVGHRGAMIRLKNEPFITIGTLSQVIENTECYGLHFYVSTADTVTGNPAIFNIVNGIRVFAHDCQGYNVPHIVRADVQSGDFCTGIYVFDNYWVGKAGYTPIDIKVNTSAAAAAGLFVRGNGGFPYNPPDNPAIVPTAITAATQANPVAITTSASHGYSTGEKVRIMSVGGMTELNGNDYTITVTGATTFTLDGVDGSGFTAYTSGGRAADLHWAIDYDNAFVKVEGKWDTIVIEGNTILHYNYLWHLKSSGVISFLFDRENIFDYGGESRGHVEWAGGNISELSIDGGWSFVMNGNFIKHTVSGSGLLLNLRVQNHVIGLTGGDLINENLGRYKDVSFDNVTVRGMGRAKDGTRYGFYAIGASASFSLSNVRFIDPDQFYGSGASIYLDPTIGVSMGGSLPIVKITDCMMAGASSAFAITTPVAGKYRLFQGNVLRNGDMPRYATSTAVTLAGSPHTYTNSSGMPENVNVKGGTVSDIELSYDNGSGTETFYSTGQTAGTFLVGRTQSIRVTYSSAPTVRAIRVNS